MRIKLASQASISFQPQVCINSCFWAFQRFLSLGSFLKNKLITIEAAGQGPWASFVQTSPTFCHHKGTRSLYTLDCTMESASCVSSRIVALVKSVLIFKPCPLVRKWYSFIVWFLVLFMCSQKLATFKYLQAFAWVSLSLRAFLA